MPEPERVYFDTCVFIELLQQSNRKRFEACEDLRAKAQAGKLIIVTSALTIAETNKLPDLTVLPEEQSRMILAFFENEYIAVRPVDRHVGEYAHELTRLHGLTPADAVHTATAVLTKSTILYTFDKKKNRRKGLLPHDGKIGKPPLRILTPPDPDDGTLFGQKNIAKVANLAMTQDKAPLSLPLKGSVAASAPAEETPE